MTNLKLNVSLPEVVPQQLHSHVLPGMQAEAAAVDRALHAALQRRTRMLANRLQPGLVLIYEKKILANSKRGRVAEWFKAAVLKFGFGHPALFYYVPFSQYFRA
jgi:hypothetical protein